MKFLYTPLFILLTLSFFSCEIQECGVAGGYEFVVPASLSPALSTYHIGDTITVRLAFSHDVYEKKQTVLSG